MKTPYRRFVFIMLAVIAIVTFPSCSRKQVSDYECPTDETFYLQFGKTGTPTTNPEYVLVNKTAFDEALCRLRRDQYVVDYLADAPNASPTPNYTPPPSVCSSENINTDKITTSGAARTEPAEESSAYDPNAVYHVKSNRLSDIRNVLNALRSPTPTPTP